MARPGGRAGGTGLGRRALLGALGVAATGGVASTGGVAATASAQETDSDDDGDGGDVGSFSVAQGGECVPVVPLAGDETVEELYDLRIPEQFGGDNGASDPGEGPYFQSNGTTDLQRDDVTVTFLYLGPRGLSLVVVHDSGAEGSDDSGGAVSWTLEGVPRGAEWAVKDDLYLDPETGEQIDSNYDRWAVDGGTHTIDWTWGTAGTDGGALRSPDPTLDLTVRPAFNDAAELWGDHYAEDPIREWHVLSFPEGRDAPERTRLALDDPVTVTAGPCDGERNGTVTVELKLRIGSFTVHRRGAIPVGLRVEEALEAHDVVAESLRFGPPDVVAEGGGARPVREGRDDGDLVFHFPMTDAGFEFGDTSAKLVGWTRDGRAIEGSTGLPLDDIGRYGSGRDDRRSGENGDDGSGGSGASGWLDALL